MVELTLTAIGWLGAALLLVAYGLASAGRMGTGGLRFQALNLSGALGLTINSGYHQAWPSAILNVLWIGIGLAALRRSRRVASS